MALSDKDIIITPNRGQSADPRIEFRGADASSGPNTISLNVYPTDNGTLSFEGSAGQLFSVTNSLTGTIFSANDVSGVPSIEVLDTGLIKLGQYAGNVLIGTGTDEGAKLHINGGAAMTNGWNRTATLRATYPSLVFNGNDTRWAALAYDAGNNFIIRVGATSADVFGSGANAISIGATTGVVALSQAGATVAGNAIVTANQSINIGTTAVTINRASGALSLAGVSIDGSAGSVANSVTFNTSGGATAGTTYNGSAARTIDYSTVGAAPSSHTHPYLLLTGGTMTGDIGFSDSGEGLTWSMNTDSAYIKFFNTGDSDTNSRLEYGTADNGNEYHRWMINNGGTNTEVMRLQIDALTATVGRINLGVTTAYMRRNSTTGCIEFYC